MGGRRSAVVIGGIVTHHGGGQSVARHGRESDVPEAVY